MQPITNGLHTPNASQNTAHICLFMICEWILMELCEADRMQAVIGNSVYLNVYELSTHAGS